MKLFEYIISRCNFDQSQRVTWINLAVSFSLHEDACIAVWLDMTIGKDAASPDPSTVIVPRKPLPIVNPSSLSQRPVYSSSTGDALHRG